MSVSVVLRFVVAVLRVSDCVRIVATVVWTPAISLAVAVAAVITLWTLISDESRFVPVGNVDDWRLENFVATQSVDTASVWASARYVALVTPHTTARAILTPVGRSMPGKIGKTPGAASIAAWAAAWTSLAIVVARNSAAASPALSQLEVNVAEKSLVDGVRADLRAGPAKAATEDESWAGICCQLGSVANAF